MKLTIVAVAVLAGVSSASAQTNFDNFTPLATSQVGSLPATAPVLLSSSNFSQERIANRANQNTITPGQDSGNWDMITANETGPDAGRYLFAPYETGTGGVMRTDLWDTNYNTRTTTIVAPGTQSFVVGDASRWTPWGSYLTAEETTGGRLFEVTNATTATQFGGSFIQRNIIPRVSHEGLAFDSAKNMYFIDELNGGSIYKFVSANANAATGNDYFAAGQTFVAKVGGGSNANATGALTWTAITDANGGFLTGSSVLSGVNATTPSGTIDGRASANLVGGTDYQRPEDLEVQISSSGDELLYVATTTTNQVYAFNLTDSIVNVFADTSTLNLSTNAAVGSGNFTSPDNLAIDAEGNIYIIEDRNGAVDDDIWFARDLNKDGDLLDSGEGLARWASNGIPGSEFTGLYFDKFNANVAYVNIQHPTSGDDSLIRITAVPEPEGYALTLAGLSVLGLLARRRRA